MLSFQMDLINLNIKAQGMPWEMLVNRKGNQVDKDLDKFLEDTAPTD